MTILRSSKIEENTRIYIINGHWVTYIIRDYITKELIMYTPIPKWTFGTKTIVHTTKEINQDSTYEDLFPKKAYSVRIERVEQPSNLKVSNLPFKLEKYATDQKAIYEITNVCEGYPLITSCKNPDALNEIEIELKNLVTDEITTKYLKDIHVEDNDIEFNHDLIHLTNSKDLAVKAYLKAAYLYSKDFKQKIDKAQNLIES